MPYLLKVVTEPDTLLAVEIMFNSADARVDRTACANGVIGATMIARYARTAVLKKAGTKKDMTQALNSQLEVYLKALKGICKASDLVT